MRFRHLLPSMLAVVVALALPSGAAEAQLRDPDLQTCELTNSTAYRDDASIAPAIAACTRVIEGGLYRGRDEAVPYTIRGYWKHRAKDLQGALEDYNRAIEIKPNHFEAYDYRADLWVDLGDDDKALADYEEATRIDPNYAAAYFSRGKIFERRGDIAAARKAYQRTLATPKRDRIAEWAHEQARARLAALPKNRL